MKLQTIVGRIAYVLAWPALWVYLRVGSRTRVVVVARDHVLLVRSWLDDGRYGLPGGGKHKHESIEQGAARELLEETGVRVQAQQLTYLATEQQARSGLKFTCHYVGFTGQTLQPLVRQKYEIAEVRWVPLAALPAMRLKPEVNRALQLLGQKD